MIAYEDRLGNGEANLVLNRATNHKPEITYLVANYNNGRFIQDCIESLYAQTNPAWHCLIADDGSTDDSLALIQPWLNHKVELLVNKRNLGKSRTLARLIEHSPTDIVGILDPDDALYPEATAAVLAAYAQTAEAGFVYTNYARYSIDLKTIIAPGDSKAIAPGRTTLTSGFIGALSTFRLRAYRQTIGYDARILYAEDRDLVYKMEEVTTFHFIDQILYKYRQVPTSHTNDPEKRRIGLRSYRLAYENALQRRNIVGIRRRLHLLYFHEIYVVRRKLPRFLHPLQRLVKQHLLPSKS